MHQQDMNDINKYILEIPIRNWNSVGSVHKIIEQNNIRDTYKELKLPFSIFVPP